MCSKTPTMPSTKACSRLKAEIDRASAVVVGAGAGLSVSAGLTYAGERFERHFADFIEKYHFKDMYSAGFYPYSTPGEYWAYWSRHIYWNRYNVPVGKAYLDLLFQLRDKDYFVVTTNVDHQFQLAGFDKRRLFYTQGDYGLWQCGRPCHNKTYDNDTAVRQMIARQKGMRVPSELVPYCPVCGARMAMNLRCDYSFVEDRGWHEADARYEEFLLRHEGQRILFLELGVGGNTPAVIKYPFWRMTAQNEKAFYACLNFGEAYCPEEIADRSLCLNADIGKVFEKMMADG